MFSQRIFTMDVGWPGRGVSLRLWMLLSTFNTHSNGTKRNKNIKHICTSKCSPARDRMCTPTLNMISNKRIFCQLFKILQQLSYRSTIPIICLQFLCFPQLNCPRAPEAGSRTTQCLLSLWPLKGTRAPWGTYTSHVSITI